MTFDKWLKKKHPELELESWQWMWVGAIGEAENMSSILLKCSDETKRALWKLLDEYSRDRRQNEQQDLRNQRQTR